MPPTKTQPPISPLTVITAVHGPYRHFGAEVILLKEYYFCYLDKKQGKDPEVSSFWENIDQISLDDHHMSQYSKKIQPKIQRQIQIPYSERKKFNN